MASRRIEVEIIGDASSLQRSFRQASSSTSQFGSFAQKAGLAVGAGMALAGAAVVKAGFSFDQMREQAQIAFTTMLGSGKKAKTFLDELQKFAAATPFQFKDLTVASQRLLAMGFSAKKIIPTMTAVGDAVAGLGGSPELMNQVITALGQIQAKGKTSAEEMLQLTEAGIPAWQMLADKIGKSVPEAMKLVTKGAIDSKTTIDAVTQGMEQRFGGMMEKQSHTFSGLLSTVSDTFQQIAGTVMAPFFNLAEKGLQKLVDHLPGIQEGIGNIASVAKGALSPVFEAFIPVIQAVIQNFQTGVIPIFKAFWSFIQSNLLPIVRALGDIFQETLQKVGAVLASHMPQIRQILDNLGTVIQNLGKVILPILAFAFEQVLPRALAVAITILAKVTSVIAAISNAIPPVVKAVETGFQAVANAIVKAAQAVKRAWDATVGFIKGLPGMVYGLALQIGQALVSGIVDGIAGLAESVKNKIVGGVHGAISGAKGLLGIHSPSTVTRDELGKPLGEGVVEGFLIGTATLPDKMSQKIQDAIERGRRVIESKRGVFETAFGRLSDRIFQAFDSETSNHETPAERLIKQITDRRQMEDLQRALDEAIASGDAKAIQRAQEDIQMVSLQRQADEERRNYESRRANLRQSLEDRLNLIQAHFDKEGGTVGELTKAITRLMNSYGVDFKTAGENLGNAFLQGLKGAIKTAAKGASAIESTIDTVAGSIKVGKIQGFATGGIVPGPLGAPQLVVAHGGETITPPGRGGGSIVVNVSGVIGSQEQVAQMIRREMLKIQGRNGNVLGTRG